MDYQDGLLDAAQAADLKQHLSACEACSAEFDALEMTVDWLEDLDEGRVPEGFTAAVIGRVNAEAHAERRRDWAPLGAAVGLAGILALAAAIFIAITVPFGAFLPAFEGLRPLAGEVMAIGGFAIDILPALAEAFVRTLSGPALCALGVNIGLLAMVIVGLRAFARRRIGLAGSALVSL
jgi:hypothetical protein